MLLARQRIMIVGSGGAGKTTFARELAVRTGLPLIHLDRHFWRPGWIQTPRDEWIECVRQLSNGDSWIIDGNYGNSLAIRVQRCDAIVFFDMSRLTCLWGAIQRWLAHRFTRRPDLPEGCPESIDLTFLRWIWDFSKNSRPRIVEAMRQAGPAVEILTITSRARARATLDAVSNARPS